MFHVEHANAECSPINSFEDRLVAECGIEKLQKVWQRTRIYTNEYEAKSHKAMT